MKTFKRHRNTIANALIWAAMMIAAALLMRGSDNSQLMLLLMVTGWFVTNGLVGESTSERCASKQSG